MSGLFTSVKTAILQAIQELKAFYSNAMGAARVGYQGDQLGDTQTTVKNVISTLVLSDKYRSENLALIPRTIASNLYAFGDSQTAGSNAATGVHYTDGLGKLLSQYRWPNIVADLNDNAMIVSNFAIGGQRLGWNALGSADWSIFNQMGGLGPNNGGQISPHVVVVMGGWNSVNNYSTTDAFFKHVKNAHEANIARLLIDHWGGIKSAGWADITNGGAPGVTPGFLTTAGASEDMPTAVGALPMQHNPFYYGDPTGFRWVTRLTNGQYSQMTLTNKRAACVFLETDAVQQGIATISVNGIAVKTVDCSSADIGTFNDDHWPIVVWLENLPAVADLRVTCEVGGTKNIRFLAFGWVEKDNGLAKNRSIIYGSTVANSANQHDPAVLFGCAKQAESAAATFSKYGVAFANPFNAWIESTDQEPQDISHLTPDGNAHVARAFMAAQKLPFMPSNHFIEM